MSYSVYIFCKSDRPVALPDIAEFVSDGVYFAESPKYSPDPIGTLGELTIRYDRSRAPLTLACIPKDDADQARGEALDATYQARVSERGKEDLRKHIESAAQVISFQFDRHDLTKDAWSMLDCLENELMKSRQGILYAYGDGFYDEGPKLVASLKK